MLHGAVDLGVILDAGGDHRRNIGCIGVRNIVNLETIEGQKGDSSKLFLLQALHQTGGSRVSIDNDVEQAVFGSNLDGGVELGVLDVKVFHQKAVVLLPDADTLLLYDGSKSIKALGGGPRHHLAHVGHGLLGTVLGLGDALGQLFEGAPLLLPRFGHLIAKLLLFFDGAGEGLEVLTLLGNVGRFGLEVLGIACQCTTEIGQCVPLTGYRLGLLGLGGIELFDLRAEVGIAILPGGELLASALLGVQSLDLAGNLVAFVLEAGNGLGGGIVFGLDVVVELGLGLGYFLGQTLDLLLVGLDGFVTGADGLVKLLAFQLELGSAGHGGGLVILEALCRDSVTTEHVGLGLHGGINGHDLVVRPAAILVELGQSLTVVVAGRLDLVELLPSLAQLLVVEGVFDGPTVPVEALVLGQLLLLALELVEALLDEGHDLLDLLDVGPVLLHLGLGLGLLLIVDGGAGHLLEELEPLGVGHGAEGIDLALLDDEVGVGLGEAGALEETHDLVLLRTLALEEELVLLVADGPTEDDLVGVLHGEAIIGVVEHDLNEGVDGR
mmetsp:Transcript_17909/g.51332  ORF Transcript_17909/g.51332 Transcript_17909/m.51332 type:complete len:553 (+) Transcript_17909:2406-4064(+)